MNKTLGQERIYTTREFADILGVHIQTVREWDNSGRLVAYRTITNKRFYTEDHIRLYYGKRKN